MKKVDFDLKQYEADFEALHKGTTGKIKIFLDRYRNSGYWRIQNMKSVAAGC